MGDLCYRLRRWIDQRSQALEPQLIAWRRDFHQHPELSNREFRTARIVADQLRRCGLQVQTEVAHTGVVGVFNGKGMGPVVALRADMDALPVSEAVEWPYASQVRTLHEGQEVGVMHACGHDCHTAILLTVAQILSEFQEDFPGRVKFIFQPAEESPPAGEEGGAELMIREGVLDHAPSPEVIFGLHVFAGMPSQTLLCRAGSAMASSDTLRIAIHGRQTHGGMPWLGVDPIVVAAQVILGLQTLCSRQIDVTREPAVLTLGSIRGGVRDNIIPARVDLLGTLRCFDAGMRVDLQRRIQRTVEKICESAGARGEVQVEPGYPVTVNSLPLTEAMRPTLERVAGVERVRTAPKLTGAEDFSRFQERIPGLFLFLGITPDGQEMADAAPNHSPDFWVDEAALILGVRTLAHLTVDYVLAKASQVEITESGLSDMDSIPSAISHWARSG